MKLDKALQIIGAVALWAFDRWRESATTRAERREQRRADRHLRALRQAEQRDAAPGRPRRKGEP